MAAALSAQMSGQMPGCPAATRVMSRKPPAASRSSAASCSAPVRRPRSSGWPRPGAGTWETTATRRSWSAGGEREHVGPERGDHAREPGEGAAGRWPAVGVSTQVAPTKRSGSAPAQPDLLGAGHGVAADEAGVVDRRDDGRLHPAHVGHHGVGPAGRVGQEPRAATSATAAAGVATKTSSAVGVVAHRRRGRPARRASSARPGSASRPGHVPAPAAQGQADRAADQAGADDLGPRGPVRRRSPAPASAGEVIAEPLGAVEVDVVELVRGPGRCARGAGRGCTGAWPRARRSRPRTAGARRRSRCPGRRWPGTCETTSAVAVKRMLIDVVLVQPVALHQRAQQLLDALGDLLGGVLVDRGGAAQGPDGGGRCHRRVACYRAAAGRRPGRRPSRCTGGGRGQGPHLVERERAPLPRGQAGVAHRADPGAHQAADRVADRLAHAPDLAVAPLVDDDAQHPGASDADRRPARSGRRRARPPGAAAAAPRAPGCPSTSARYSLATPWEGWVSSWARSPSLVSISRPSVSRSSRPTGNTRGSAGTRVDHGRPPLGVGGGGDHAGRLVQQVVDEAGRHRHRHAVDRDRGRGRGRPAGRARPRSPLTVTRPAAISSSQTRRLPKPARARPSGGARRRLRRLGRRRRPAPASAAQSASATGSARPAGLLELARHLGAGQEVLDRGQLLERGRGPGAPRTGRWCRRGRAGPGPRRGPPPRCSPAARAGGPRRRRSRPRSAEIWARDTGWR